MRPEDSFHFQVCTEPRPVSLPAQLQGMPNRLAKCETLRAELNLPFARVRVVSFEAQKFEISGILGCHWLQMALTSRPGMSGLRFTSQSRSHRYEAVGDMFLLPPNEPMSSRGEALAHSGIICEFDTEGVENRLQTKLRPVALYSNLRLRNRSMESVLKHLAGELLNPGMAHEQMCELLTAQVAVQIARHYGLLEQHRWVGGLTPRQLKLIDDRLAILEDIPNLTELADLCRLSVRHLTRAFRVSRHCSIGDFLAEKRIVHAKHLLAQDQSVKEVAMRLGFSSANNFATAFRKMTGETPRQYRFSGKCNICN